MSLYQEKKPWWKRIKPEWIMSGIVAINALLLAASSFMNTTFLADILKIPPELAIGFIDLQFVTLLVIRKIQEARGYRVAWFVSLTYWFAVAVLGAVSTYGLYKRAGKIGILAGVVLVISLVAMDNIFAWLLSDKSRIKAKTPLWKRFYNEWKERIELRAIQYLEWKRHEASKPSLSLIKKARKADEKRKKIEADGLPEFFLQREDPVEKIVAELHETQPKTVDVQESEEVKEVVPFRRQIGFHMERTDEKPKSPAPLFQPNMEARKEAIETAKRLQKELGRLPKQRELIESGISEYYAKWARKELKNQ